MNKKENKLTDILTLINSFLLKKTINRFNIIVIVHTTIILSKYHERKNNDIFKMMPEYS